MVPFGGGWDGRGRGRGKTGGCPKVPRIYMSRGSKAAERYLAIYRGTCMDVAIAGGEPRDTAIGGVTPSTLRHVEVL